MFHSANYEELSGQMDPFVVRSYLRRTGWVSYQVRRNDISVFQYIKNGRVEQITIPEDRTLSDYSLAMFMVARTIAEVEKRTVRQLLLTLLNPNADILWTCLEDPNAGAGTVSVDSAVALYNNLRKLIVASACDILHPESWHAGYPADSVREFVSQCRFGQTEAGGYTVPLICPFVGMDGTSYDLQTVLEKTDECAQSLTRQASRHLIEGILAIKTAIDTGAEPKVPVSASFCDAILGICEQSTNVRVEFQMQWSPVVGKNIPPASLVHLNSNCTAQIRAISRRLWSEQR